MALIDPEAVTRLEIPHEPGQWVELKPVTARDLAELQREGEGLTKAEVTLRILKRCLTAWSYGSAVSAETLDALDFETFNWLDNQVLLTGRRSEEEKKDSASASSPTSAPATATSRRSSAT